MKDFRNYAMIMKKKSKYNKIKNILLNLLKKRSK
jgi:hypothetical protein